MQIQTWRQAMWLAEAGVVQHVLTIGFPGLPTVRDLHRNLRVERAFIPLPEFRSEVTGIWGLTQAWGLATALRLRRIRPGDVDLVHAHLDGQIPAMLVAWAVRRLLKKPLVLSVHCSRRAVYRPVSTFDRWQHRLACWCEGRALRAADHVVALTASTAEVLGMVAQHVTVVPDIIDPATFVRPPDDDVEAFRRRHGLRRRTVGYVGRIAAEKGWEHLIPLARHLSRDGIGLLVVGDGPKRARLDKEIARNGLRDWVTVTGFLPNFAVPAAMAACEALVMPSAHEEFGGVSIEAYAIGVPVVAFAVGGLREVVGEITPHLLARPGDIDDMIAKLRAVLDDAQREPARPELLRSRVIERFAPGRVLTPILELYGRYTAVGRLTP
ncbi:glycosyltransferase [Sphingomonas zeae]